MKYCVTINDKRYEVEVEKGSAAILSTTEIPFEIIKNINQAEEQIAAAKETPKVVKMQEQPAEVTPETGREVVKAPMAGGIINIKVSVGSAVKKGDILILLEAMKMENEITAHVDGTVAEIKVAKGANVSAGDVLVVLR
jgi:biotin carboxyl carrier protein